SDESREARAVPAARTSVRGRNGLLDPGRGDDEVGRETEQDPGHEQPGDEHRMAVLAVHRKQLPDDVEDRATGDGEEDDRDGIARPRLPDDGAEKGGRPSDQAEQAEQPPARDDAGAAQRAADAEPLRRVVQAETD